MLTDRIHSRWRLLLALILVFCVMTAGGLYTYAVLSDEESVEVNIKGTSGTLITPAPLSLLTSMLVPIGMPVDESRWITNERWNDVPRG